MQVRKRIKLVVAVGLAVVALIGLIWIRPPTDSGAMASWVQAVGSVLAIVGAAWVARDQFEWTDQHVAVNARRARRDRLEAWYQLLSAAKQKATAAIAETAERGLDRDWLDVLDAELETLIAAAERLDVNVLTNYVEMEPVIAGIAATRVLHRRVLQAIRTVVADGEGDEVFMRDVSFVVDALTQRTQALEMRIALVEVE